MNYYKTSNGERISKSEIDSKVRKAKAEKLEDQCDEEYSYNFCEKCGRSSGVYLDCSHVLSVKYCQENGMSENAFDKDNIKILCRECHQALDGLDLRF
jgi:hypothetical protein